MKRDSLLYKQVAEHLAGLIIAHIGEANYKLPTEAELEQTLGVSRITVRKAFSLLEEADLIIRSKRGGTRINGELSREAVYAMLQMNGYIKDTVPREVKTIAVILPKMDGGSQHIAGILAAIIEKHGDTNVIVDCSSMSMEKEQKLLDKYIALNVDGIILYPVDNEIYNPTILRLSTVKFPLILVDRLLSGLSLPYVSSDHENMVKIAVDHLLEMGHKYILFFNANIKTNSSLATRKESFINALYSAHNYRPYFYSFEGDADPTSLSFCEELRQFLDANPKISAIIAADYSSGLHLAKMLSILGEPYENNFEIVYLDFDPVQFESLLSKTTPTYIMQDSHMIGAEAIKLMHSALNGNNISNTKIIVPVSIVYAK